MIIELLFNFFMDVGFSLYNALKLVTFDNLAVPVQYFQAFFSFLNVALWLLPVNIIPILIAVPSIWGFKIIVTIVDQVLEFFNKTPILKHI